MSHASTEDPPSPPIPEVSGSSRIAHLRRVLQAPPTPRAMFFTASFILIASALLLFVRLGHYALWEDEALTAMPAANVWRTGDMGGMWGRNLTALHDGAELSHLKFRYMPPLQYYIAAPFVGIMTNALGARLPFALCGLGCVAVMLMWIRRTGAPLSSWVILGSAILGNVSFFLYARQCRYYALVLLLSTLLAYCYVHWNGRTRSLAWISFLSILLFASNYLSFFAAYCCIGVDYLAFRRQTHRMTRGQWGMLAIPQLLVGLPIAFIWNPLNKHYYQHRSMSWIAGKLTLLLWNLRDLNTNEFFPATLVAVALVIAPLVRDSALRRACVALAVYILSSTLLSPQPISYGGLADVRYLVAVIPLGILLCVLILQYVAERSVLVAMILAVAAFGTNLIHLNFIADESAMHQFTGTGPVIGVHSSFCRFVHELYHPSTDCFTAAADWINQNVPAGKMVIVEPRYMMYPLIFHAPNVVYGWQLYKPADDALRALPDVDFTGRIPPNYVIRFGSKAEQTVVDALQRFQDDGYDLQLRALIPIYWQGTYRPELMLRRFTPATRFNVYGDSISIWETVPPKASPPTSPSPETRPR